MKKEFKTPVAMKVTWEQYKEDLEEPLKELGYGYTCSRGNSEYLKTNYGNSNSSIGFSTPRGHKIKNYNPELFLAIAAMTEGEDWIVGEWLVSKVEATYPDKIFKCSKDYGCNSEIGCAGNDYKEYYRKATLEELRDYFNNTIKTDSIKKLKVGDRIKALVDKPNGGSIVKKHSVGKVIREENSDTVIVDFPENSFYFVNRILNDSLYKLLSTEEESDSNIPDEFFVRYCEGFTEDIFNKLNEWASKNSKGKIRDYNDSYEFFIKNKLSIWRFNFCKENSTNSLSYGVDNHNWGNKVTTEYSLEQVKELIGYEELDVSPERLKEAEKELRYSRPKIQEESLYRFKTEEEFKRDDLWNYSNDTPFNWNSNKQMNYYLGKNVPNNSNNNCANGESICVYRNGSYWTFRKTDYVLKSENPLLEKEVFQKPSIPKKCVKSKNNVEKTKSIKIDKKPSKKQDSYTDMKNIVI